MTTSSRALSPEIANPSPPSWVPLISALVCYYKAEEGGDIAIVQELHGYRDVATTRRYLHVKKKDIRAAMEKQLSAQTPHNNEEGAE